VIDIDIKGRHQYLHKLGFIPRENMDRRFALGGKRNWQSKREKEVLTRG